MKKRKPPIVLGAILLIMFGVVFAVNASNFSASTPAEPGAAFDDEAPVGETRGTDEGAISDALNGAKDDPKAPKANPTGEMMPLSKPGYQGPKVVIPENKATRPKPTSGMAGQWYRPDHRMTKSNDSN